MKLENVEKLEGCGFFPTPLHKLERLSEEFGCNIYLKREDLSGIGFSGNKIRKLQYLIKEAIAQGCTTLLTYGGVQTNHGRQTAAIAAKYGMKSVIIANMDEAGPPEVLSGNLLLDRILDCDIRFMDLSEIRKNTEGKSPEEVKAEIAEYRRVCADKVIKEYETKGEKVYEIPAGGSTPIGCVGYIECVREILGQMEDNGLVMDAVFCPSGSQGTFAGLWLGAKYYRAPFQILGSCVSLHSETYKAQLAEFINRVSEIYEMGVRCSAEELDIYCSEVAGIGYDVPDKDTFQIIYKVARAEGIFLDPCYTGKGFAGMLRAVREGKFAPGSNLLFLHTGAS